MKKESKIIIYQTEDGKISVDTLMKDETIWLSQKSMALLFDCSVDNIGLHLKNIYKTAELSEKATSEDFSIVQKEGTHDGSYKLKHCKFDYQIH